MKFSKAHIYILFSLLITFSSWIRWYSTGTLKADENFIYNELALYSCVLLYYIGIIGTMWVLYHIVRQSPGYELSKNQTIKISLTCMIIYLFMTVIFASDVYTYLAEGELWTRGILTYTNGSLVRQSLFIDYVSDWWKECPNHYGSPLLYLFSISCHIGKTLFKSYLTFKILIFLIGLVYLYILTKLEDTIQDSQYNYFALIVLSPILMIEGIGQVHVEIFITLLLAAAMLAIENNKIYLSSFFIGIAIACKILYAMILLPLFVSLVFVYHRSLHSNFKVIAQYILLELAFIVLVVSLCYTPIWEGAETILNPISYHSLKTPSRSYTEIIILFYRYGIEIWSNGFSLSELMVNAQSPDFLPISKVIELKNKIVPYFAGVGILLAIWNLIPLIKLKEVKSVYYYFAKLWIIIIVIYSPIFNPWYFMPILLLMFYHRKTNWIFYLTVVTSFSINYQIGNSIPPSSYLNVIVSLSMILMLVLFLYKFYSHFIKEPFEEIKNISLKFLNE